MQTGRRSCFWVLLVIVAVLASCDVASRPGARAEAGGAQTMSPELRAAYIAAVQAQASEAYRVEPAVTALSAANPAQGFTAEFTRAGVELAPARAEGARWSVVPARWGCERDLSTVPSAEPEALGNRVEYRRGGFVEWYVNGPLGLEQGFTLREAPPCRALGGGAVMIELRSSGGLTPALIEGGLAVDLRDAAGRTVLRYTDLYVVDAVGRSLPARLGVSEGSLSIRVEDAGATYPLVIDPLMWGQQAKLLAQGGMANEQFGSSVAIDGDTAVIGAHYAGTKGIAAGAAYVFVRTGTTWTQQQQLLGGDSATGDEAGFSVAVSGDTVVVGAYRDDDKGTDSGSAYVFVRSGTTWTQQQKLVPSDGSADAYFGWAVAVSGETAIIGAYWDDEKAVNAGAAYVYVRSGATWALQQKLTAADAAATNAFGESVALEGDTAVVGSPNDAQGGTVAGSAYVFVRSGVTWTQQQKLLPADLGPSKAFGHAVAISGDTAVVGAVLDDTIAPNSGATYVFVRSGITWTEQQKLIASDAAKWANFGHTVAVMGDTAVVGAYRDAANGQDAGATYIFVRAGMTWTQQQKLLPADVATNDQFGNSVALSGTTVIVGVHYDSDNGLASGSAYIFVPGASIGAPCAAAADCASSFCVDGVCCNTTCGGGANDCQACNVAGLVGTCSPAVAGTSCRASAGVCDVAELCDGKTLSCPPDAFAPDGMVCANGTCAGGVCQSMSGSSASGSAGNGGGGATGSGGSGGAGGSGNEGGCGCRAAGASSPGGAAWLSLGLALVVRRRRRGR